MNSSWFNEPLPRYPTINQPKETALKIRQVLGLRRSGPVPLERAVGELGWRVYNWTKATPTNQALLIPRKGGHFDIPINADSLLINGDAKKFDLRTSKQRFRFLLGHELAHAAFYFVKAGSQPRSSFVQSRLSPYASYNPKTGYSTFDQLEDYCDKVALNLIR